MENPIVLLADIHGNFEALKQVLSTLPEDSNYDILCLGDVVGYGPEPDRCISELQNRNAVAVAGNHDAAACGQLSTDRFNRLARASAKWTQKTLNEDELNYLRKLPRTHDRNGLLAVHGTPDDPLMEYLMNSFQAQRTMQSVSQKILGVGHTHQPVCFREELNGSFETVPINGNKTLRWDPNSSKQMVINPGSVGQPRDGDPRASYAILNPNQTSVQWKRVQYPIEKVQQKIYDSELPPALGHRLERGQ